MVLTRSTSIQASRTDEIGYLLPKDVLRHSHLRIDQAPPNAGVKALQVAADFAAALPVQGALQVANYTDRVIDLPGA